MDLAEKAGRYLPAWISHISSKLDARTGRASVLRRAVWVSVGIGWAWAAPMSAFADGYGPFPVRNFQPLHQLVLGLPGDRATVLKPGALDLRIELANTANVFEDSTARTAVAMKFESLRSGVFLRYGLTDRVELAAELPVLVRYRGIMDGMIEAVERATTGLAPDRKALRNAGYVFNMSSGGRTVMSGKEGVAGLGDASLMGKYQVLSETASLPALSLRAAVKLPTGDAGEFLGSGSPDYGLGLAVEKHVAPDWVVYGNLNGVLPTGRIAGFALQPVVSAVVAVEYLWSNNFSLVAHFDYYSSPFRSTDTSVLDKGVTEVVLGFNYQLKSGLLWQVYGVENVDFIVGSAADFTLSTTITYRFGS